MNRTVTYHVDYIKLLGGKLHTRNLRSEEALLKWMQTHGVHYAYLFVRRVEEDGTDDQG